jgi:hypothetical protein
MVRAGPYPLVVLPDRLLLLRLALEGEFRQIPHRLWFRRYRAGVVMSNRRQRRAFFTEGAPLWAYVPWPLTHTFLFARYGGGRLSAALLVESVRRAVASRWERGSRRWRWRRRRWLRGSRAVARRALERLALRGPLPSAIDRSADIVAFPPTVLAGLERAELLADLAVPGAVVVELGRASPGLEALLRQRCANLVYRRADDPDGFPDRVDLAVSMDGLGGLPDDEASRWIGRLYELGAQTIVSLDRETERLRRSLAADYWLRDVWIEELGRAGRKPDPITGPVGRAPGRHRLTVGRRRLLSGLEGDG